MTITGPGTSAETLLTACLDPPGTRTTAAIKTLICCAEPRWGELLWLAIQHKAECLLADALTQPGLAELLPSRLRHFFHRSLRGSQHAAAIYRSEAARISKALDAAAITAAATGGIAVESVLYGGRGARQFSDLDLITVASQADRLAETLAAQGYRRGRPGSGLATPGIWHRATGDIIVPLVVIDLHTGLPHVAGEPTADLEEALSRRVRQPIPGHPEARLPVLAPGDQLRHARAAAEQKRAEGIANIRLLADIRRMQIAGGCIPLTGVTA
ncbi:MAG TPA: nucleotidyltransferase family protein [Streptosporangiaceae bacterium]|nr:nucleotidyltransferase family protein [Streptosporangiaceae bacterium]